MSNKLKVTTIISDEETGKILTKQESIISVDEYIPKNYFGLKNTGHDLSYLDHMKKYGTVNEPTCDSYDRVIPDISGTVNDEVTAACKEYIDKDFSNLSEVEKDIKALSGLKNYIESK